MKNNITASDVELAKRVKELKGIISDEDSLLTGMM